MLLQYFDNNKKDPLIFFIHGTASNNTVWDKQYELLDKLGFRVIGVDLRGHGLSKHNGGVCTMDDHLNDLKETIDFLQIKDKIIFVGHSLGAVLAIKFAEKYPNLTSKLLLVSLPIRVPRLLCFYYRWLLKNPFRILRQNMKFIAWVPFLKKVKIALGTDLNILWQIWKDSMIWDFLSQIPKVKCPVYLSVGRFDYISLKSQVKIFHGLLPDSNCKVFKWSFHNCMEQEPDEFNKWLLVTLAIPISSLSIC